LEKHRRAAAQVAAPGSSVVAAWVTSGQWRGPPGYGFYYRSKELETLAQAIADAELEERVRASCVAFREDAPTSTVLAILTGDTPGAHLGGELTRDLVKLADREEDGLEVGDEDIRALVLKAWGT
jgi:hypothetical protein